ncbi:MAG: polar amino acid transport system ATP-binding protein, partial [Paraburkholderia sp.]|nr:polar amino acid transport system ATP-binding protein [Paraburkholderia sp.]
MNGLRIKHKIAGAIGMLAMLVWHPARAAGLAGVEVLDGFRELAGYVGSPFLLGGAWVAVKITLIAMSTGLVLGLGLALMRLSRFKSLNSVAWGYIWFVRGTPQL